MKPVLTGDNGDQAANISNILACEDHPGPFTVGPPEPLGLIPRWPWWGCIYVRSVPLGSADVLGSRPRKGGRVTPECARLRADIGRSGLGPESAFRALSALRLLFLAAGCALMGRSGSVGTLPLSSAPRTNRPFAIETSWRLLRNTDKFSDICLVWSQELKSASPGSMYILNFALTSKSKSGLCHHG